MESFDFRLPSSLKQRGREAADKHRYGSLSELVREALRDKITHLASDGRVNGDAKTQDLVEELSRDWGTVHIEYSPGGDPSERWIVSNGQEDSSDGEERMAAKGRSPTKALKNAIGGDHPSPVDVEWPEQ